ncbi:hypothetical protein JYQ62_13465 [Nostoc sp. UHCC 0702]|nr:hypothetical protein JYQ62_13465 [Nostoc sp. UHCC 0702]
MLFRPLPQPLSDAERGAKTLAVPTTGLIENGGRYSRGLGTGDWGLGTG